MKPCLSRPPLRTPRLCGAIGFSLCLLCILFALSKPAIGGRAEGCVPGGESFVLAQKTADADLRVETSSLPDAIFRRPYFRRLDARGGKPPYRWALDVPYLPDGLQLDEKTGTLSGTPTNLDQFDFTLEVTDSSRPPQSARRSFALNVVNQLVLHPWEPRWTLDGIRGQPYRLSFPAGGGTRPFRWELTEGRLPTGMELNASSGVAGGRPTETGVFRFSVRVTDSGSTPQTDQQSYILKVVAPLEIAWAEPPRIRDAGIFGAVRVSNGTRDDLDLTVIIVAVNEYGKAFALGYHRFTLKAGEETRGLLFGFTLPKGAYTVHADAVAEFAPSLAIYRARLQQGPLLLE